MSANTLPDAQRRILQLFASGKTAGETAAQLGFTETAVIKAVRDAVSQALRGEFGVSALFDRARNHDVQRIRTLGERADLYLTQLREAMAEEDARADARLRVTALEAQLAEARKALGLTAKAPKSDQGKKIRTWAAENGVDVPSRGRIPAAVFQQYSEAQS